MEQELKSLQQEALSAISSASDLNALNDVRVKYLGKKGSLTSILRGMGKLSPEERPRVGQMVNTARKELEDAISAKQTELKQAELANRLATEKIDVTLPGRRQALGHLHPLTVTLNNIKNIFTSMGYSIAEGPQIESDYFNFEALNLPKDHPARDMQDTLYIDDTLLLRSHTSSVQAHVMEKANGKPIKIICPGKTFRRDDDDMTHSHQFAQVEGLVIDKNINLGNLKATLELFAQKMFSKDSKIRFRSSYFPFTEPSVEVDVSCFNCKGKGCSVCKGSGWIEILGAGMVHPNVLKMSGYDPEIYSGYAFGIGIERVAMLRYGIDDIRRFYQSDIRFIESFNKKDEE